MDRHHWFSVAAACLESRSDLAGRILNLTPNHNTLHYFTHELLANATAAAVVGGTASVLGGDKFANGAITGAFSRFFNDWKCAWRGQVAHRTLQGYLKARDGGNIWCCERGHIDLRHTPTNGIYELKPISHQNDPELYGQAKAQLAAYIADSGYIYHAGDAGIVLAGRGWWPGSTFRFTYHRDQFGRSTGLLFYEHRNYNSLTE